MAISIPARGYPVSISTNSAMPRSSGCGASLSVVVLSQGSRSDLARAVDVMAPSILRFGAQLVVARAEDGMSSAALLQDHPKAAIVRAPVGASRAQLCDVAMAAATGDIVALRDDHAVRDGKWLDSFSGSVRTRDSRAEISVSDFDNLSHPSERSARPN